MRPKLSFLIASILFAGWAELFAAPLVFAQNLAEANAAMCRADGALAEGIAKLRDSGMALDSTLSMLNDSVPLTTKIEGIATAVYSAPKVSPDRIKNLIYLNCKATVNSQQ
jgi:hypothetical protein